MIKFNIQFGFDEETKQFIAEISSLNLSDFGNSLEEAYENLMKALQLYIEEKYDLPVKKELKNETL